MATFRKLPLNWKISFISFCALVLELAFIRQIPAEIKAISYFSNLILFASFFGLGIGCMLADRKPLHYLLPVGVTLLFVFISVTRGIVIYEDADSIHYWLTTSVESSEPLVSIPLYWAALFAFLLSAIPLVAIGQALAQAMDSKDRLSAYAWDIFGSLCGVITFALSSRLGVPPWAWVCVCLFGWSLVFFKSWKQRLLCAFSGSIFLFFAISPHPWIWSPYYFIQYEPTSTYLSVWVNSSFHQQAVHFESDPEHEKRIASLQKRFEKPYEWYRDYHSGKGPENVLILGAGTGNDVNIALFNGAHTITAVEIDPSILDLGKKYNWLSPYQNGAVRIVNNDARNFLRTSQEKFDLIVFGTLDSQTLLSGQANLRLENYVYTQECFKDARALLKKGGMLAAYYSVFKDWFVGRIYSTVREAFPDSLKLHFFKDNALFNTIVYAANDLPEFKSDPLADTAFGEVIPSSDDWPYIYLQSPTLAPIYIQVLLSLIALIFGVFIWLRKAHPRENIGRQLPFFLLGFGFTLLESAGIVKLALLFGSTWVVNSVVFASALIMIFLSNLLVIRQREPGLLVAFSGILTLVLANFVIPVDSLLSLPNGLQLLGAFILIGGPIFFAGICFSSLFKKQAHTGFALGMNLIGAMGGGLIEYLSMVIGMRNVWIIIFVIYLGAGILTLIQENVPMKKRFVASESIKI